MSRRLFLPTARQTNWLLIVGFLSIGYALYLRYAVIEQSSVSLACEGGLNTWLCATRNVQTGVVWFTKILTDPFHDVKMYHTAPIWLLRGQWLDPMENAQDLP